MSLPWLLSWRETADPRFITAPAAFDREWVGAQAQFDQTFPRFKRSKGGKRRGEFLPGSLQC